MWVRLLAGNSALWSVFFMEFLSGCFQAFCFSAAVFPLWCMYVITRWWSKQGDWLQACSIDESGDYFAEYMKLQEEQNDAELKKQHNLLFPLPRYYVFLSFTAFDALPYTTAKSIIGVLLFGTQLSACQIHKPSCYCCKLKRVFVCMKQQSQASSIHLIQDQDQCDVLCTHVITCEGSFWETSCMQLSWMEHLVEIWKNLWGR
jgi:hypothetical protein